MVKSILPMESGHGVYPPAYPDTCTRTYWDKNKGVIAKADLFGVALELNSVFFDKVAKEVETEVAAKEKALKLSADLATRTEQFFDGLIAGLKKVFDNPTMKQWDSEVKQLGRSVSNNLKENPELAKKYLKMWTTKFQVCDWNTL